MPARPATILRRILLPLAGLLACGCSGGAQDVNAENLGRAERAWSGAKVRDYDLEWTTRGERDAHYRVFVRDGQVRAVHQFVEDRRAGVVREIRAKPGDPSYYSIDGLFKIIREEQAQLEEGESPFGRPKGTQVLLKFTPDPKLGYPTRYRRDVVGHPKGLALDVIRFEPRPAGAPVPAEP